MRTAWIYNNRKITNIKFYHLIKFYLIKYFALLQFFYIFRRR